MLEKVAYGCLLALFLALGMNLIRIIRGPSMADRVLAADAIMMNLVAVSGVYSIYMKTYYFYDLVLVFSLLAFVGTVSFSKYLGRGRIVE